MPPSIRMGVELGGAFVFHPRGLEQPMPAPKSRQSGTRRPAQSRRPHTPQAAPTAPAPRTTLPASVRPLLEQARRVAYELAEVLHQAHGQAADVSAPGAEAIEGLEFQLQDIRDSLLKLREVANG